MTQGQQGKLSRASTPSTGLFAEDTAPTLESLRREVERLRLLASEDGGLLEVLLKHSPHGVIVCDTSGELVLQNPASERIWAGSKSAKQIASWADYRAFHPDGQPYAGEDWPMARCLRQQTEVGATELRIQRFDDSYGWLIGSCAPVYGKGGALEGALSIFVDVTGLKDAERERAEAAERLDFLGEVSSLLSSSLDYEETLQQLARSCVPTLADWCAIDVREDSGVIRRLAAEHLDPENVKLARELHERYPIDHKALTGVPNVLRTGQPEWVPVITSELIEAGGLDEEHLHAVRALGLRSYACLPLKARGRTFGALTLVFAESDRRYSEKDLRLATELARRAAVLIDNARLYEHAQEALAAADHERQHRERLITALARSNAELDQFAYVASHDLKAPLRGISNLSSWIEEDLDEAMTPDTRSQMKLLRGRVERMEGLIDGILSYSRAGRSTDAAAPVDVKGLLESVIDLLPSGAAVRIGPDMPVVLAARAPLQQVFLNLIGNALKHSDKGSPEVVVKAISEEREWRFLVKDNGPGIAPEFQDRIWGLFQMLRRRDEVEGAGIGLSVVRKIVEQNGGSVGLESSAGAGATFFFTWPKSPHAYA